MSIELLIENLSMQNYINQAWQRILDLGIDMRGMSVDHVGIRTPWGHEGEGDYSNYLAAKRYLESRRATLIAEAIIPMTIEGRPIAIYRLLNPIDTDGGKVQYVEIPAPRKGKIEENKLDHIEIVLKEGETLASFIEKNRTSLEQFTSQDLDKIAMNEVTSVNPDVTLALGEGIIVKFHTQDIGHVVTHEQQEQVIKTLQDLLVKAFNEIAPGVMSL